MRRFRTGTAFNYGVNFTATGGYASYVSDVLYNGTKDAQVTATNNTVYTENIVISHNEQMNVSVNSTTNGIARDSGRHFFEVINMTNVTESHDATATEGTTETFTLTGQVNLFSTLGGEFGRANVTLEYNGVNYTTVATNGSNGLWTFTRDITTPTITATSAVMNGTYYFYLDGDNGTLPFTQTVNRNATLFQINFDRNVTAEVHTKNASGNYSSNNLTIVLRGLPDGRVQMRIRRTNTNVTANWEQYYEFINDGVSRNVTMEVLTNINSYLHFQVVDTGNNPIKDSYVEYWVARPGSITTDFFTGQPYNFTGQRLTDDDGITYFQVALADTIRIVYYKEGYKTGSVTLKYNEENINLSRSSPIILKLEEEPRKNISNIRVWTVNRFSNRTKAIPVILHVPWYALATVTTQYAENAGFANATPRSLTLNRWLYNLTPGVHFPIVSNNNISLYIYEKSCPLFCDWTLQWNISIAYRVNATNEILPLSVFSSLDRNVLNAIIGLFIIIVSFGASMAYKGVDAGKHTFLITTMLATIISTSFALAAVICAMYYVLRAAKDVMSE